MILKHIYRIKIHFSYFYDLDDDDDDDDDDDRVGREEDVFVLSFDPISQRWNKEKVCHLHKIVLMQRQQNILKKRSKEASQD